MWSNQKSLSALLSGVVLERRVDLFGKFEATLNETAANFLDVLKDKPNSAGERDKVRKRDLSLFVKRPGAPTSATLSSSLIDEALTLSDLFALSEVSCVELLLEAEEQMPYFQGFNRGLTAILLYYDAKKIAINNLKTLIMARPGRTWILDENMPAEVAEFIGGYVNKLVGKGLVSNLLSNIFIHY